MCLSETGVATWCWYAGGSGSAGTRVAVVLGTEGAPNTFVHSKLPLSSYIRRDGVGRACSAAFEDGFPGLITSILYSW